MQIFFVVPAFPPVYVIKLPFVVPVKTLLKAEHTQHNGDIDLEEKIKQLAFIFEEGLSKEMKRVFIFFANKKKTLYKKINESLHYKDQFDQFGLSDFQQQYEEGN